MGIESVAKQAESTVLISGIGPLGIEIAKNIILAGCKELILHDTESTSMADVSGGQFFLSEADISDKSKTRAQLSRNKLQQLNQYVKVTVLDRDTDLVEYLVNSDTHIAVFTDNLVTPNNNQLIEINEKFRSRLQMIIADQHGLFSRIVTDFGSKGHIILDKDGEERTDVMIKDMQPNADGSTCHIKALLDVNHGLEKGDNITNNSFGSDRPQLRCT